MAKLIRLTKSDDGGKQVWVNVDQVLVIEPSGDGSRVSMSGAIKEFFFLNVTEDPTAIASQIDGAAVNRYAAPRPSPPPREVRFQG